MRDMKAIYRSRIILTGSITPKADLEVFLKLQKPLATVLTHSIAVVSLGMPTI